MRAALEYAEEVLNDPAALNEVSIQAAMDRLNAAKETLLKVLDLNTDLLAWLLEETRSADESLYLSDGLQTLHEAQTQAEAILKDPQSEEQISSALSTLHQAWLALRFKASESLLNELAQTGEKLMSLSLENCSVQLRSAVQELKPQMDALLEADEADQEEVRETLQKAKTLIAEINSQNQEKDPDSALQKPDQTLQNPADTDPANEKTAAAQAEKTDSAKNSTQPAKSVKTAAFFGTGMLLSVSAGAMLLAAALRKRQKAEK